MAAITAKMVADLRAKTDAPMMECKKALTEADGDMVRAEEILRVKLGNKAGKAASRVTAEGVIAAAVSGTTGAMIEVNCETDFVARTDQFKEFVHYVALHIAALKPRFVSAEDVPEDYVASERAIYEAQAQDIPEHARARAVEGKLAKHLSSICLLEQEFVRDQNEKKPRTIEQLRVEASAGLGENVTIRRFSLFELGQ